MKLNQQLQLTDVARTLSNHQPTVRAVNDRGHAAVAMLLRTGLDALEVLFIIRAEHDLDPWSGNIGFPGGRLNSNGETPRQAAERETREELAYDLAQARYLGRLDDLYGSIMPVLVSCFVYHVENPVIIQPNHEIGSTFWCPLPRLLESNRHQQQDFFYRGQESTHPVVALLDDQQPFLWGITYRLVRNFFVLCGHDFGSHARSSAQQS